MELNEELLNELKKHTEAINKAMPDVSKEEKLKIITKAITDSADIQDEMKEEFIKILSTMLD